MVYCILMRLEEHTWYYYTTESYWNLWTAQITVLIDLSVLTVGQHIYKNKTIERLYQPGQRQSFRTNLLCRNAKDCIFSQIHHSRNTLNWIRTYGMSLVMCPYGCLEAALNCIVGKFKIIDQEEVGVGGGDGDVWSTLLQSHCDPDGKWPLEDTAIHHVPAFCQKTRHVFIPFSLATWTPIAMCERVFPIFLFFWASSSEICTSTGFIILHCTPELIIRFNN